MTSSGDNAPPLKMALVGPGHIGHRHAAQYAKMPDVQVVGVVGTERPKAEALAHDLGAEPFDSLDSLFAAGEVDVVDLCTPTPLHKEGVQAAAGAGKHVICEKPLARNLQDAEEIVNACRSAGVTLMVGHVLRFFPQYEAARSIVLSGSIGAPAIARTFRGNGFPHGWHDWYAHPSESGGVLLDMLLHDFDWLRWTFGEVERVYAKGLVKDVPQGRDYALVTIRHRSGVLAHVEGTWCHTTPFNMKLEVAGDAGLLDYDDSQAKPVRFTPRQEEGGEIKKVAVPESPLAEDPYYRELRHFADVIQGKAEPLITPDDALAAMRIALAALESVETGKAITLG